MTSRRLENVALTGKKVAAVQLACQMHAPAERLENVALTGKKVAAVQLACQVHAPAERLGQNEAEREGLLS